MNPTQSRNPELTQSLESETVVQHGSAPDAGAAAGVSTQWRVGDVIMDTYEVKRIHEGGAIWAASIAFITANGTATLR